MTSNFLSLWAYPRNAQLRAFSPSLRPIRLLAYALRLTCYGTYGNSWQTVQTDLDSIRIEKLWSDTMTAEGPGFSAYSANSGIVTAPSRQTCEERLAQITV